MIIVRIIDAPTGLKGFVRADEDGNENIYINGRLSEAEKKRTYEHEMLHVKRGHLFDDTKTNEEKEAEIDGEGSEIEIRELEYTSI